MAREFSLGESVLYTDSAGCRREMCIYGKKLDQTYLLAISALAKCLSLVAVVLK